MATVTATMAKPATALGIDQWVCIPATWELYLGHLEARGEHSRPKYTYVDGRLTVVSPGTPHEHFKNRLGGLIDEILVGLRIKFWPTGGVTLLKTMARRTGTEPDVSYYLTNIDVPRKQKDLLMGVHPAPDLVVEVVVSNPEHDSVEACREFGVREVWVCGEPELRFLVLGKDGQYSRSEKSAVLPFLSAAELAAWLYRDEADEAELRFQFRAWVTDTLLPRHRTEA